MKPAPFEYDAPATLAEALELKARYGDEAKCLAGGQSLIPAMNFRFLQPARLLDLNRLAELEYIRHVGDELRIGAMTRQRRLEREAAVRDWSPLLHEAMPWVAHPQIRNRGTFGGSLAHADPAAELPVVALALGARVRLQSAAGERWLTAGEFFQGTFTTAIRPDEILVEVALPRSAARTGAAFVEVARRRGDYAMAGVAAVVTLDASKKCREAKLVYLNLGDGPVDAPKAAEALRGQAASPSGIDEAAQVAAEQEIDPLGNVHASPAYQRHLARVVTRRALATAFERAAGQ